MSLTYSAGGAMPLPQLAWDFNGTTTDYVKGVSGSVRGVVNYETGKIGTSLNIKNPSGTTSNSINFNFGSSFSIDSGFSECVWFKCNDLSYLTSIQIVSIAYSGYNNPFRFQINTGGSLQFQFQDSVGNKNINMFSPTIGAWYHLIAVAFNGVIIIYVNGAYYAQTAYVQSGITLDNISLGLATNFAGYPLTNGSYDDLRIYNTALTAAQVQSIYNQQGVPGRGVQQATHLLSLIPSSPVFMQTFGTSSVPSSDLYGATLTSSGAPTMYLDSMRGYVFPGTGSTYMNSNFNLPVSYSKSVWVYLTGAPGSGNLISSVSGSVNGIHFLYFSATYSVRAGHHTGTTVLTYVVDSGTITLNKWTHYVLTYDQSTTTMKLFRDGVQVASTTNAAMSWSGGNAVGLCHYSGSNRLSNGYIDNPIIYNRALNEGEIYTLYNAQLNNPTLGETTSSLQYNPISLSGTPLFTQLSTTATSSAVGAFSLRAVNGGTAKAVAVQAHPVVQWPPVAMTSNTSVISGQLYGNGTYITSSSNGYVNMATSTSQAEFRAFDYNTSSYWEENYPLGGSYVANTGVLVTPTQYETTVNGAVAQGNWLQIQLPTAVILRNYTIVPRTGWEFRCPGTFWIAGSTNGTTWSNVHFQSGITGYTNPVGISFTVPITSNSIPYSYYRLIVNKTVPLGYNAGNTILNIVSWNLFGDAANYAPNAAQDFYADRRGNLLTAPVTGQTLANWLGTATGYVTTWYDQSGRGNHATQATAANQPIITKATKGPGYMVLFNGVNGTTSYGLNFGAYDILNNTSYSVCGVVRRKASGATNNENYYLSGAGGTNSQDQKFHNGYRLSAQFTLAHYSDDMNVTVPAFTAPETEPINYNFSTLGTDKVGRIYSYSGGSLYPSPTTTRTFVGFLNHAVGTSFSIGGGFRQFTGEIYEVLVFTKSLYDLDGTSTITQIYNNQVGIYGT